MANLMLFRHGSLRRIRTFGTAPGNGSGKEMTEPSWLTGLTSMKIFGVSSIVIGSSESVPLLTSSLHTRFGRHIYAVGGSSDASHLAGVKVNVVLTSAYTICALRGGVACVLLTARL